MLALDGVVAGYEGVPVVGPLDMTVPARSTVALVGANGAGKTTALHAIAGLVPVMSGTIALAGRELQSAPASARARAGVGYALEGHRVFPEMTVQENLLAGLPRALRRDPHALDECLALFPALAPRRSQLAGSLSGGERQMLALARVLARRPDIVLLDEPSLGLAPMLVAAVFDSIAALARSGRTILVAEQNAERALAVADHAYVLELGRVVAAGAPDELRAGDALTTAYLGGRA